MKVRQGFVSNSSSASFVVKKEDLTGKQIEQIKNYQEVASRIGGYDEPTGDISKDCGKYGWVDDFWSVSDLGDILEGYTIMDNFNFPAFMADIGVPEEVVEFTYH